ncbi:MAG: hypothetical protein ACJ77K_19155 [Bacteroidia bacterium]
MNRKIYNCYIPHNLNLEEYLAEHKPGFKFIIANFYYILNLLSEIPSFNKQNLNDGGYVSINSSLLQTKIKNYTLYLAYLKKHGFIESDGKYTPGEKSIGYRYSSKFHSSHLVEKEVSKWSHDKACQLIDDEPSEHTYSYLRRWFNNDLTMDKKAAAAWLKKEFKIEYTSASTSVARNEVYAKYLSRQFSITQFGGNSFRFKVDKTGNRVHTNLTNLYSPLRKFIKYSGKELASLDLRNSQPFLSTLLLRPEFYYSEQESSLKLNEFLKKDQITPILKGIQDLRTGSNKKDKGEEEKKTIMAVSYEGEMPLNTTYQFIQKVQEGSFYHFLQKEFNLSNPGRQWDLNLAKKKTFQILFSANDAVKYPGSEHIRLFQWLFHDVYEIFFQYKIKDYKLLAILLQRIESKLFLDVIAAQISSLYPNMPLFTIHDSIVCPMEMVEQIRKIMVEEITKHVRLCPTIKIESWK